MHGLDGMLLYVLVDLYADVVHWASAGHWENCFCPPSITTTKGNNRSKQNQYIS